MSHFSVAVILGTDIDPNNFKQVEDRVEELMAPYDENLDIPPFKVRPDTDEYFFSGLRYEDAIKEKYGEPQRKDYGDTEGDDRRAIYNDNKRAEREFEERIVADLTPEEVVKILNDHEGDYLIDGQLPYGYDEQGFYQWSKRNPNSKWDYWRVGGRWSGSILVKPDADMGRNPEVAWEFTFDRKADLNLQGFQNLPTEKATALKEDNPYAGRRSDIARIGEIDFEGNARLQRAERAESLAQYEKAVASGEDEKISAFRFLGWDDKPPTNAEEREAYINNIHGLYFYAYVTEDGVWHAKGEMGWFGMSHDEVDEDTYRAEWDALLSSLDPRTVIAVTDCHI